MEEETISPSQARQCMSESMITSIRIQRRATKSNAEQQEQSRAGISQRYPEMSIWRDLSICRTVKFLCKDPACNEAVYSQVAEPLESYFSQPAHTRIVQICDLCVYCLLF